MKNAPTGKTNKSALDALLSIVIVLANPAYQQTLSLLALMQLLCMGVML